MHKDCSCDFERKDTFIGECHYLYKKRCIHHRSICDLLCRTKLKEGISLEFLNFSDSDYYGGEVSYASTHALDMMYFVYLKSNKLI